VSFTPFVCHGCGKEIVLPEHGELPVFARVMPLKRVCEPPGWWHAGTHYEFPNACSPECFQKILDDPSWERAMRP
jgi:hypothetical protein